MPIWGGSCEALKYRWMSGEEVGFGDVTLKNSRLLAKPPSLGVDKSSFIRDPIHRVHQEVDTKIAGAAGAAGRAARGGQWSS